MVNQTCGEACLSRASIGSRRTSLAPGEAIHHNRRRSPRSWAAKLSPSAHKELSHV